MADTDNKVETDKEDKEVTTDKEQVEEAKAPRVTKASLMQSVLGDMYKMDKAALEGLTDHVNKTKAAKTVETPGGGEDVSVGDFHEPNPKDYKADLQELFGSDVGDQFIDDACAIFAASVNSRVMAEQARMDQEFKDNLKLVKERFEQRETDMEGRYSKALTESVAEYKTAAESRIDRYLSHIAEEWTNDHKETVETSLKVQMAESLLSGMVRLIEDHDIKIEEGRFERLERRFERREDQIARLKESLNEAEKRIIETETQLAESKRTDIVGELTEGMTLEQKERMNVLTENLSIDNEKDFKRQAEALKVTLSERARVKGATKESRLLSEGANAPIAPVNIENDTAMGDMQRAVLESARKLSIR